MRMNICRIIIHGDYKAILRPHYREDLKRHLYIMTLLKNKTAYCEENGYLEFDLDVSDECVKRKIDLISSCYLPH